MNFLINLDVPDLPSAVAFYQQALGFTLSRYLDDDVAELAGGPCPVFLLQKPAHSPAITQTRIRRDYSRHWTPVHLDIIVDDLTTAASRAEQAGAVRESECISWRGSECITFSDPFGHGFCLIKFLHKAYMS